MTAVGTLVASVLTLDGQTVLLSSTTSSSSSASPATLAVAVSTLSAGTTITAGGAASTVTGDSVVEIIGTAATTLTAGSAASSVTDDSVAVQGVTIALASSPLPATTSSTSTYSPPSVSSTQTVIQGRPSILGSVSIAPLPTTSSRNSSSSTLQAGTTIVTLVSTIVTSGQPVTVTAAPSSGGSPGLSGGAIAGIVIGALAAVAFAGLLGWFLLRRRRSGRPHIAAATGDRAIHEKDGVAVSELQGSGGAGEAGGKALYELHSHPSELEGEKAVGTLSPVEMGLKSAVGTQTKRMSGGEDEAS